MSHVSDFTQNGDKIVLDLINESNNSALSLDQVTVALKSVQSPTTKNTQAVVTAKVDSGYSGSMLVEYDRLDIQDFVDLYYPEGIVLQQGDAETISDIIPEVEAGLGIRLTEGIDYQDKPIGEWSGEPNETKSFTLQMIYSSMIYIGNLEIILDGNDIQLASVIRTTVLDGLNLPVRELLASKTTFILDPEAPASYLLPLDVVEITLDDGAPQLVVANTFTVPAGTETMTIRNVSPGITVAFGETSVSPAVVEITAFQSDNPPAVNFVKTEHLTKLPTQIPAVMTSLENICAGASNYEGNDVVGWDVSQIRNFNNAFADCSVFDQDLSDWDVSNAVTWTSFDLGADAWELPKPNFNSAPATGNQPHDPDHPAFQGEMTFDVTTSSSESRFTVTDGGVLSVKTVVGGVETELTPYQQSSGPEFTVPSNFTGQVVIELDEDYSKIHLENSFNDGAEWVLTSWGSKHLQQYVLKLRTLVDVPEVLPPTVISLSSMFENCRKFVGTGVSSWYTAGVYEMLGTFYDCRVFNQDLSGWDVSNVSIMTYAFAAAQTFNQDLSGWNVSEVTDYDGFDLGAVAWVLPKPNFE